VREIPECIQTGEAPAVLSDIANRLLTGKPAENEIFDSLLHMIACKSAVRSGDRATEEELLSLVSDVLENDNIRYCPHGRPVMTTLSIQELEKQFRRQV
jgi:DNA mismatch repair protein MutL